jgi:hypothetical protein
MRGKLWTLAGVLAVLAGFACSNEAAGPVAGTLTVTLATANADGAMLFEITGPEISAAAPAGTAIQYLATRAIGAATLRVVVVGSLGSGAILTFNVPNVNAASSYAATVIEVADRQNQLRSRLNEYTLSVAR